MKCFIVLQDSDIGPGFDSYYIIGGFTANTKVSERRVCVNKCKILCILVDFTMSCHK